MEAKNYRICKFKSDGTWKYGFFHQWIDGAFAIVEDREGKPDLVEITQIIFLENLSYWYSSIKGEYIIETNHK
ncbi:MAG: hypothetical protein LBP72_01420 [Dysgonamonadaceae bacterium]|jgi:hypothetical protein|nr:hypothetical protein [Dysgonamonadaceae bacterium]